MMQNSFFKSVSFFALLVFLFALSGCSSKQYYKPKDVIGSWERISPLKSEIVSANQEVGLYENGTIVTKEGDSNVTLGTLGRSVGVSGGWFIGTTSDGNVTLKSLTDAKKIELALKKTVAAATIKGEILAVLFASNEMALYNIQTKELLFKEQGSPSIINNAKMVNPYFMEDLVLFFTLDGKLSIIHATQKKRLRTTIISSQNHFNNVIFATILDNKIIAATSHKILSLGENEQRVNYEMRSAATLGNRLYIATKGGEVISMTPELAINAKVKLPFSHIVAMHADNEKLYALEKEGYVIVFEADLSAHKVYRVDGLDTSVFVTNKSFLMDDERIWLE